MKDSKDWITFEQLKVNLRKNPDYRKLDDAVEEIYKAAGVKKTKLELTDAIFNLIHLEQENCDKKLNQQLDELEEEIEEEKRKAEMHYNVQIIEYLEHLISLINSKRK